MDLIFFYSLLGQCRHLSTWLIQIMALLQILYNVNSLGFFSVWSQRKLWTTANFLKFFYVHKALSLFVCFRNLLDIICKFCQGENQRGKGTTQFYETNHCKPRFTHFWIITFFFIFWTITFNLTQFTLVI